MRAVVWSPQMRQCNAFSMEWHAASPARTALLYEVDKHSFTFHCRCRLVSQKHGVVLFAQHPCTRSAGKYVVSRQAQASQQLQTSPQQCLVSHASMPGELVHQAVVIMHVSANAGFACF